MWSEETRKQAENFRRFVTKNPVVLGDYTYGMKVMALLADALAEIERLEHNYTVVYGDCEKFETEVGRLSEVLEQIVNLTHEDGCTHKLWPLGECGCETEKDVARDALSGPPRDAEAQEG